MQLKPLAQQVVVVFGASSGIGRATAILASLQGATVVAAGRDEQALETLARQSGPGEVVTGLADAADALAVTSIARLATNHFGRIDTWAHVAGVGQYGRFEHLTPEEFRRVIEVDLLGPVYGAMAALPHLRKQGGAYIVVSSALARRSLPLLSAYCAAKHGIDGFVDSLRAELRHDHIPVSVTQVLPAGISTPFFDHARTLLGVRGSAPPPIYRPEKVANAILDAAQHPRREVIVGGAAKALLWLQRLSPVLSDQFARRSFPLQTSNEPKRSREDDNLYAVPKGEDRVHGSVTTTHR
jgi:NAD(P)-dependent dehydrogenase (short-subunit alcohol dehydrogenase family)